MPNGINRQTKHAAIEFFGVSRNSSFSDGSICCTYTRTIAGVVANRCQKEHYIDKRDEVIAPPS
jgi:hypothetical protein